MDQRSPCTWCGAFNKTGAAYCGQCFKDPSTGPQTVSLTAVGNGAPLSAVAAGSGGLTAVAVEAPPTGFPLPTVAPPATPRGASPSAPPPLTSPPREVRWRLRDLSIVGASAWGLPMLLDVLVSESQGNAGILDRSLVFQLIGYIVAAFAVSMVIKIRHHGDWSSIGISWHDRKLDEVGRGALFGLLLIGVWLPVAVILRGGQFGLDRLMRLLVGETTTAGLLLAGVVLVIGAPIIEEIYYRGLWFSWLKRWGVGAAVVASSLLFVNAHGAILIPALLLLGFGLGLKRRTKSLWYTMGAHAAWNFVVLILAAQVLLGGGLTTFTSEEGGYSFKHRPAWDRLPQLEGAKGGAQVDFAAESPMGSVMMVGRISMPPMVADEALPLLLTNFQKGMTASSTTPGPPQLMTMSFDGFPVAYEARGTATNEGVNLRTRVIALMEPTGDTSMLLSLVCPEEDCTTAEKDFAKSLETLRLK